MEEIQKGILTNTGIIFFKICFYANLIAIPLVILIPFINLYWNSIFPGTNITTFFLSILIITIPTSILWVFSLYFYYQYDRYSSAGLKLLFFGIFFAPVYFYKVIWKRRRQLHSTYNAEPVIGNTIEIEDYIELKLK